MVQKNKVLIHSCCAICSGYPIQLLKELGYSPVVFFCNPNLDSLEEFDRRLASQKKLCDFYNVELIVDEYCHSEYLDYVRGLENEPEKGLRCDKCIELRLIKTANLAKELGIFNITTSLVISPHKNFDKISDLGRKIAEKKDLTYLDINFRKNDGFLKTNRISKDLELYRQNYCGCEFAKKNINSIQAY